MSDETGPALSRRALREARRAEAEAQLDREAAAGQKPVPPAPKPEAAKPAAAKPAVAKPAAEVVAPKAAAPAAQPAPKPVAKPVAKPAAQPVEKPAVAKPVEKPAAAKPAATPVQNPVAAKPAAQTVPAPAEPARSRRATTGEVDAVPERTERTSLQRARDREALRTRRRLEQEVSELSPKDPAPAEDPAPLTRKQMRLQALGAAKDAGAAQVPAAAPSPLATKDKAAPAKAAPAKPAPAKPASAKPAAAQPESDSEAPSPQMSVEEALALRRRSGGAAPSEPLLIAPEEDLADVDLEVLAQQRELAARAAIISRRAAERLRMQEENTQRAGARRSDPFTGAMNHLVEEDIEKKLVNTGISGPLTRGYSIAMTDQGTIVEEPQTDAAPATKTPASAPRAPQPTTPAAKAPAVTPAHKPKAATPAQASAGGSKPPAAKQAAAAAPAKAPVAPAAGKAVVAPESRDARAEDVGPSTARPPVRAVRAQGLEPLDVQTAGMRRANNMYLMVIAALSVGGAALVAGLIMFLNSN
ncbi:hypothetical protein [Paeniglutamicibacter psychrophenolicus]|nr:hypothetical protein [Paeniglutamicibacter psychrophenolicus]